MCGCLKCGRVLNSPLRARGCVGACAWACAVLASREGECWCWCVPVMGGRQAKQQQQQGKRCVVCVVLGKNKKLEKNKKFCVVAVAGSRRVYRYARAVAVSLVSWGFAVRGTDRVLIGQGYCSLGGRTHSGGMWVVQIIAAILHPSGKDKTYSTVNVLQDVLQDVQYPTAPGEYSWCPGGLTCVPW